MMVTVVDTGARIDAPGRLSGTGVVAPESRRFRLLMKGSWLGQPSCIADVRANSGSPDRLPTRSVDAADVRANSGSPDWIPTRSVDAADVRANSGAPDNVRPIHVAFVSGEPDFGSSTDRQVCTVVVGGYAGATSGFPDHRLPFFVTVAVYLRQWIRSGQNQSTKSLSRWWELRIQVGSAPRE